MYTLSSTRMTVADFLHNSLLTTTAHRKVMATLKVYCQGLSISGIFWDRPYSVCQLNCPVGFINLIYGIKRGIDKAGILRLRVQAL